MATDCVVTWAGGSQRIKDAELGDERISALLDRLYACRAQQLRIDFVDASPEPQPGDQK